VGLELTFLYSIHGINEGVQNSEAVVRPVIPKRATTRHAPRRNRVPLIGSPSPWSCPPPSFPYFHLLLSSIITLFVPSPWLELQLQPVKPLAGGCLERYRKSLALLLRRSRPVNPWQLFVHWRFTNSRWVKLFFNHCCTFVTKLTLQDYCYICINGGELLSCDQCTRVMCLSHLPLPQDQSVDITTSIFICVPCHLRIFTPSKPAPFFVSVLNSSSCFYNDVS